VRPIAETVQERSQIPSVSVWGFKGNLWGIFPKSPNPSGKLLWEVLLFDMKG